MKIVVLDGYAENPGDLSWDEIAALGTLTVYDRTSFTDEAEIIERIGDAEVVVTNKTPVSRRVIDSCPSMKLIAVIATGYNVVDCGRAKEKGVLVANVPSYGTAAVGQFAVALLLEICCRVGHHDRTVHEGKWENCSDWCYWGLPDNRTCRQDHGNHRLRQNRTADRKNCKSHGNGRYRVRRQPDRRRA